MRERVADHVIFLDEGHVAAAGRQPSFSAPNSRKCSGATPAVLPEGANDAYSCPAAEKLWSNRWLPPASRACLDSETTLVPLRTALPTLERNARCFLACVSPWLCYRSARLRWACAGLRRARSVHRRLPGVSRAGRSRAGFQPSENPVTVDNRRQATTSSPSWPRRQHPRILATYGGEYSDPKLERMVAKVVGRLTCDIGQSGADLPHHHPQLAQRQRLRAARAAISTSPAGCWRWPTIRPSWRR